jgi:hypothetical protein
MILLAAMMEIFFNEYSAWLRGTILERCKLLDFKDLKGERRARSSRLPVSPFGECPASLTEGGQPVVCWPGYETPERRKKLRSDEKKLSRIRGAAQPHVHPRSAYATSLTLEPR